MACPKTILISGRPMMASEGNFGLKFNKSLNCLWIPGYKSSIIGNKLHIDAILGGLGACNPRTKKFLISGCSVVTSEGILGKISQTFELKKSLFVGINFALYAIND